MKYVIPVEIINIIDKLNNNGFEAYIVGGCVRDLLLEKIPADWDITTSAKPEKILELFDKSFYDNKFLTVKIPTGSLKDNLEFIEVTTYRKEGKYSDGRHPREVGYGENLQADLSRRDFTINAMALDSEKNVLIDPFCGQKDLDEKMIKAVGEADARFSEDALRMMRAIRFATTLNFEIDRDTFAAIINNSQSINKISADRIRDEFLKIISSEYGLRGIELLQQSGLLKQIIPELEEGIGIENRPIKYTIWEHNLRSFDYACKTGYSADIRIAALFHDIGKPRTKGEQKNGEWTFYGHDYVGSQMAYTILKRLNFSAASIKKVTKIIRWHLFKYDPNDGITDSAIRRIITNVEAENMSDLIKLRICDRMGIGVPKPIPYRLRHFQFRVEKILKEEQQPSPKMLKIDGGQIMQILKIQPGPIIGKINEVLVQEIIDNPELNNLEYLEKRVVELSKLTNNQLEQMAKAAEEKIELVKDQNISKIKSKHFVK